MYWNAFIIAFVVAAAVGDLLHRQIPRWLTVGGLVIGLAFHFVHGGLGPAIVAMLIGFGLGLTLFRIGAIGGGDVKLITALGAMLGLAQWSTAMEAAILVAGLIALVQTLRRGVLRRTLANMWTLFRWLPSMGLRPHPQINVQNASLLRAPFALAAALGTIFSVWHA